MNGSVSSNPLLNPDAIGAAIAHCRCELKELESRLGTSAERRGDLDRASEIVHRINNLNAALLAVTE